ncbi:MAG: DUF488 domain-containing protein [Caldilineaceae bacterium]|nr:DUF488 domain-containing protein [Caldilineaceae bacterium]
MTTASSPSPIYTIGYGTREIDDFIRLLQQYAIAYLIDVRTAPYSRYRPEFSRRQLEERLQAAGIRYIFMGDQLGGRPDDPACYVDDKADYGRMAQRADYLAGIERLQRAAEQGQQVILMCSEGKPQECHRSKLIGKTLTEDGIDVIHLDENDASCTQEEIIFRITGGQLGLFGDPEFTSRKRYPAEKADPRDE